MIATKLAPGLVAAATLLAAAATASAQAPEPATSKFYVNVNVGGQLADRTLDTQATKTVYEESATLTSSQSIGKGALVDFGGGYRVFGDVFVGLTISRFSNTSDAAISTRVPDPVRFDTFATVSGTAADLKHTEVAVLPQIVWATPLTDKIDFAAGIGPAFIHLSQDLVGDFTVQDRTQNVTPVSTTETGNGTGFAATVDFIYGINERYGVGAFLRYAGAKVDLPSAADSVNVGGMQTGIGVRLRF
jgi:hypothetical protein